MMNPVRQQAERSIRGASGASAWFPGEEEASGASRIFQESSRSAAEGHVSLMSTLHSTLSESHGDTFT